MQGSVSASPEQITWVLTSYIVSAAIMTPMSGWLADRLGRKKMFMISIAGFTVASMLCGIATSLPEIVLFRLLQGMFGAALIPLSQAVLLDINPPEKHGQAMAIWGAGAILGPILGPALGGYLTENFSWRWCFFINLPIGILAFLGVLFFISGDRNIRKKPFDFLGFGMLTLFIGAFQVALDRGPSQDWFQSTEIWTECILAVISLWIFVIHTATTKHPFFDLALIHSRAGSGQFGHIGGDEIPWRRLYENEGDHRENKHQKRQDQQPFQDVGEHTFLYIRTVCLMARTETVRTVRAGNVDRRIQRGRAGKICLWP